MDCSSFIYNTMTFILTKICETVIASEATGKKIIKLHTVDQLHTDTEILESARKAISLHTAGYCSSAGITPLRKIIAENYDLKEDNVVIGSGSRHLLFGLIEILLKNEEQVIIPDPEWAHFLQFSLQPKAIKRIPGHPIDEREFLHNLKKAADDKTRAVLISNPNNPTGRIFSERLINEISLFCNKKNIYFIIDTAYEPLAFIKIKQKTKRRKDLIIGSFSKGFALAGFRIGYIVGKDKKILNRLIQYNYNTIQCCPIFTQLAALQAWRQKDVLWNKQRKIFKNKFNLASSILTNHGANFIIPNSGPFIYLPIKRKNAEKTCLKMVKEMSVALCPSTAFGLNKNYLRISLTASDADIKIGINKLMKKLRPHLKLKSIRMH